MARNKKLIFVPLFLLIIAVGFWFILKEEKTDKEAGLGINQIENGVADIRYQPNKAENQNCITKIEEKIVRGNSLAGLIEEGQTIKALFGHYDCRDIKREDVILYSFAGKEMPLIKIVKGMPGDKFNLQETSGGWHILINGKTLKNSKDEPYLLDEKRFNMLSLYVKDYNAVIPEKTFLIMGNLITGTADSSQYGLIHKSDILGKAEI